MTQQTLISAIVLAGYTIWIIIQNAYIRHDQWLFDLFEQFPAEIEDL